MATTPTTRKPRTPAAPVAVPGEACPTCGRTVPGPADAARSDAARRAWETIRANRAAGILPAAQRKAAELAEREAAQAAAAAAAKADAAKAPRKPRARKAPAA